MNEYCNEKSRIIKVMHNDEHKDMHSDESSERISHVIDEPLHKMSHTSV